MQALFINPGMRYPGIAFRSAGIDVCIFSQHIAQILQIIIPDILLPPVRDIQAALTAQIPVVELQILKAAGQSWRMYMHLAYALRLIAAV